MTKPAIAEIVTFRLHPGTPPETFRDAVAQMTPFIERSGGMIGRTLSVDTDGLWTDHVLWRSMDEAKTLAEAFMTAPETEAARALIDPETVVMRHADIWMQQG